MRVIRSAGQNVSPSDDGRLFDQAFTDGLFEEATITATGGNTITLSALYGIICGRDFTAEAQTISATLPDSDTATGYVYVEFDTSSEDIITIGTALAPFTPTYEDINTNGAVVQMVIAQYEASAVAVTSVTPTYMTATAGSVKAGSIATVEKSPAVANHSIGEFILYGGDLYEVTSAIAAGETLVVGTNIAAASIGDELSALNNGLMNFELLWSNPNPSTAFAAQTITQDFSGYRLFYIDYLNNNSYYGGLVVGKGNQYMMTMLHFASNGGNYYRAVTMSDNNAVFGAGGRGGEGSNNNYCVPQHIYGIK